MDPGLLGMLLLQEFIGLHAALAGLLRLRPREAYLGVGVGGVTASDWDPSWATAPVPTSRPGYPI